MALLESFHRWYVDSCLPVADPRTQDWPLLGDYWQPLSIAAIYLFVVFIGPRLMANRRALDLSNVLIIYNFGMSLLSAYMFYEFLMSALNISWMCATIDLANEGAPLRLANVCWVYYFSKVIEFFDTFFFILRKKNEQLTFLHVYHHVSMFLWWWLVTKWYPGGSSFFGAGCNSFVHIVMYAYYMLSAMGPNVRRHLWWKKYLTYFQMIQFVIVMGQNMCILYTACGFSVWLAKANTIYMFSLLLLFLNFSSKRYHPKDAEKKRS